jgi:hypothetical protein
MINRTGTTLDASDIPYDSQRTVIVQLDEGGGGIIHLPCARCEGIYYQDFESLAEIKSITVVRLLTQLCPDCADVDEGDSD